jgi:hypothetical protein
MSRSAGREALGRGRESPRRLAQPLSSFSSIRLPTSIACSVCCALSQWRISGLRLRGDDEAQPVAARPARHVGQDLDDVAGAQGRAQRHQPAVDARAGAVVAEVGVDAIGEVERRRAAGKAKTSPLGEKT